MKPNQTNFATYANGALKAPQIRMSVLRAFVTNAHGLFGHDFKRC